MTLYFIIPFINHTQQITISGANLEGGARTHLASRKNFQRGPAAPSPRVGKFGEGNQVQKWGGGQGNQVGGNYNHPYINFCFRCLDLGFQQALNSIIEALPPKRQTLLFSATQTRSEYVLIS